MKKILPQILVILLSEVLGKKRVKSLGCGGTFWPLSFYGTAVFAIFNSSYLSFQLVVLVDNPCCVHDWRLNICRTGLHMPSAIH